MAMTVNIYPAANGSYQQCAQQYPASGSHYDKLSTNDGYETYVKSSRVGGTTFYETYRFNFPAGIYSNITLKMWVCCESGSYGHYSKSGAFVYSPAGSYASGLTALACGPSNFALKSYSFSTNPITGAAWGVIDNTTEFGFKGWQCCNNESMLITQLYLTVTYEPLSSGGAQIIGLSDI